MVKACNKCKENRDLSEFYKDRTKKDGLCGRCKVCDRIMPRNSNRVVYNLKNRNWMLRHPEKTSAHQMVSRAIKKGILLRPLYCEKCSQQKKIQAHHDDYSKPLEVKWLCSWCHSQHHKALKGAVHG